MNECQQKIEAAVKLAQRGARKMDDYAVKSANSHDAGCEGDCVIDRQPSYDSSDPEAIVQKTSFGNCDNGTLYVFHRPSGKTQYSMSTSSARAREISQALAGRKDAPIWGHRFDCD